MPTRRQLLIAAAAATAAPPAFAAGDAEAELKAALDEIFATTLAESPETVTQLGLDNGPRADAKSRLRDLSLEAWTRRRGQTEAQAAKLSAMDRKALSGMAAVNYDAVLYGLRTDAEGDRRFHFGDGSDPYVISQITGAWQSVPDFLATQHTIETTADAEAYLTRLEAFAQQMDQERERVAHDVALGVIPPDFAVTGALAQMKVLHAPPEASGLVTSLVERARAKGLAGDWGARARAIHTAKVLPALERQMTLLEGLRPRARPEPGVWALPDGEAYYAHALRSRTTSNLTPAEVHKLGLDITRELTARADVLFRKIGMSGGTVAERYAALFKDPRYVYPNTDAGKAKEVADLNALVQGMRRRLPAWFTTLPKADLLIQRIPPATEAGASTHYTDGSLDGSRPGIYWLNLRDTGEAPWWDMPTTTYHEGIPGHHLQLSLQRQADLPMIRKISDYGAYVEGWALYAEQLSQEMGVYADDPAGELGYVHDALLRSGRLVTDTGIHALRWSRDQAIRVLHETDGDPLALCAQEIERYSVWPGQACTYMVGKVTILRLREKAKAALGPRFDIRAFHEAVLSAGSMPLEVLEAVVDNHIAARRA